MPYPTIVSTPILQADRSNQADSILAALGDPEQAAKRITADRFLSTLPALPEPSSTPSKDQSDSAALSSADQAPSAAATAAPTPGPTATPNATTVQSSSSAAGMSSAATATMRGPTTGLDQGTASGDTASTVVDQGAASGDPPESPALSPPTTGYDTSLTPNPRSSGVAATPPQPSNDRASTADQFLTSLGPLPDYSTTSTIPTPPPYRPAPISSPTPSPSSGASPMAASLVHSPPSVSPSLPGNSESTARYSTLQDNGPASTVDASSHQSFVSSLQPLAESWAAKTGIPAEAWLAMGASESNWGNAGNALFGIKGSGTKGSLNSPTWESVNGQRVNITDNFADYQTPNDAFQGFWDLMWTPRYAPATAYLQRSGDWRGFLQQINAAGYATDPTWGQGIANIAQTSIRPLMGAPRGSGNVMGEMRAAPSADATDTSQNAAQTSQDAATGSSDTSTASQPVVAPSNAPGAPTPGYNDMAGASSSPSFSVPDLGSGALSPDTAATSPSTFSVPSAQDAPLIGPMLSPPPYNDMVGASSGPPNQGLSSTFGTPPGIQAPQPAPIFAAGYNDMSGADSPQPDYSHLPGMGGVQPLPGANPLVNIPQAIAQRVGDTAQEYNQAFTPTRPTPPGAGPFARYTPEQLAAQNQLGLNMVLGVNGEAPKVVGEAGKAVEAAAPSIVDLLQQGQPVTGVPAVDDSLSQTLREMESRIAQRQSTTNQGMGQFASDPAREDEMWRTLAQDKLFGGNVITPGRMPDFLSELQQLHDANSGFSGYRYPVSSGERDPFASPTIGQVARGEVAWHPGLNGAVSTNPSGSSLMAGTNSLNDSIRRSVLQTPIERGIGESSTRFYHGTGSAFDSPEAAKFDPNGLFGPGYYLTSDARVASSYADNAQGAVTSLQKDLDGYIQQKAAGGLSDRRAYLVDQQIAKLQQQIDQLAPAAGPNVRAVNVPQGLKLLNMETGAPRPMQDAARSLAEKAIGRGATYGTPSYAPVADINRALSGGSLTAARLYDVMSGAASQMNGVGQDKATVNALLQKAGYDGLTYNGGQRIPLSDENGAPIQHTAVVIFPDSLPKITNALSGKPMGVPPSVGGAVLGGVVGSQAPAENDQQRARNIAVGALGGGLLGHGLAAAGRGETAPLGMSIRRVSAEEAAAQSALKNAPPAEKLASAQGLWSATKGIAAQLGRDATTRGLDQGGFAHDLSFNDQVVQDAVQALPQAVGTSAHAEQAAAIYRDETQYALQQLGTDVQNRIGQLKAIRDGLQASFDPALVKFAGLVDPLTTDWRPMTVQAYTNLTGKGLSPNAVMLGKGGIRYVNPDYAYDELATMAGQPDMEALRKALVQTARDQKRLADVRQQIAAVGQVAGPLNRLTKENAAAVAAHTPSAEPSILGAPTQGPQAAPGAAAQAGNAQQTAIQRGLLPGVAPKGTGSGIGGATGPATVPRVQPIFAPQPASLGGRARQGIAQAINQLVAPVRNAPPEVQTAVKDFANTRLATQVAAESLGKEAKSVLGANDNAAAASLFERTGQFVANPTPAQSAFAAKVKQLMTDTGDVARQHGYISGDVTAGDAPQVDSYFPHIYRDNLTKAASAARRSGLNPNDFYSNSRVFPTLDAATAAGFTPVDSSSGPLQHYLGRIGDSEAKYQLVENLKNASPAAAIPYKPGQKLPHGWVPGMATVPQFAGYAFPEPVARSLNNIVGPSAWRGTAIGNAYLNLAGEGKQLLFSLSGFHNVTELRQAIAANGIKGVPVVAEALKNGFLPGAWDSYRLSEAPVMEAAARSGVTGLAGDTKALDVGGHVSGLRGLALRSGFGAAAGASTGYGIAAASGKDDQTKVEYALVGALGGAAAGPLMKPIADALWERQVPTLKLETWKVQVAAGRSPEAAAQFVNNTYGGQNLATIARSKTVQDTARFLFLAPDWWESWAKQLGSVAQGGDVGGMGRAYWARQAVLSTFTLEGLNYALNHHFTDQNDPDHANQLEVTGLYKMMGVDRRDPKTGAPIREYMSVLPSPIESLLNLSGGQFTKFAMGRAGVVPRLFAQQASNKDYRGQPIVPPYTPTLEAAKLRAANVLGQVSPIGVQSLETGAAGNEPTSVAAFAAATGLRTAPASKATYAGPQVSQASYDVIHQSGVNWHPSPVGNSVGTVSLNRDERERYQALTDQYRDAAIAALPSDPSWQKATSAMKVNRLRGIESAASTRAGGDVTRSISPAERALRQQMERDAANVKAGGASSGP